MLINRFFILYFFLSSILLFSQNTEGIEIHPNSKKGSSSQSLGLPPVTGLNELSKLLMTELISVADSNVQLSSTDEATFIALQEQFKKSYLASLNDQKPTVVKGLAEKIEERKKKDLKGGMLLLAGIMAMGAGGSSFYLSELYYDKYDAAETTAEAIQLRKTTQALDFFKFVLVAGGIAMAAGSSSYFLQGPDHDELTLALARAKAKKEFYYAR